MKTDTWCFPMPSRASNCGGCRTRSIIGRNSARRTGSTGSNAANRRRRFATFRSALEKDEIFVDIVDHPSYYGCLGQFTGVQPMFLAEQVRTVPRWPLSYTSWHPDVPHSNPLHIKVQIYVNDVDPGCGECAFVPGSHKRTAGPYTRPVFRKACRGTGPSSARQAPP